MRPRNTNRREFLQTTLITSGATLLDFLTRELS